MENRKKRSDATPRHPQGPSQPAMPGGGVHTTHPETVKPDESGKGPTKRADRSQSDVRTKDDKDANEQQ